MRFDLVAHEQLPAGTTASRLYDNWVDAVEAALENEMSSDELARLLDGLSFETAGRRLDLYPFEQAERLINSFRYELAVELIIRSWPSAVSEWTAEIDAGGGGGNARLYYCEFDDLVNTLVDAATQGNFTDCQSVFGATEHLLAEGDAWVENLVTVGFLEGLQNVAGWARRDGKNVSPEVFEPFLPSRTRAAWDELNRSWSKTGSTSKSK